MLLLLFSVFRSSLKKALGFAAVQVTEHVPLAWKSRASKMKEKTMTSAQGKGQSPSQQNDNMQPNLTSVSQTRKGPLNLTEL